MGCTVLLFTMVICAVVVALQINADAGYNSSSSQYVKIDTIWDEALGQKDGEEERGMKEEVSIEWGLKAHEKTNFYRVED